MTAEAGSFTRWCVEKHLGTRPVAALEAALRHYAQSLALRGRPLEVPRQLLEPAPPASWSEVELSSSSADLASLEREAARQRISVDRMLTHALFVYLSALDADELD